MLLRLNVQNYRSIAKKQEFSFVATNLKGPQSNLAPIPGTGELKALPCALIYGANASGKTNFVNAFRFMKGAVLFSHRQANPEGGVPRIAFALDENIGSSPTFLEADFVVENVRYQYGFECDDDRFLTEWLYSFPEGKRRKLFERKDNSVDFGPHLRGPKRALVEFMRPNSLFISTATQNDHENLSKIVMFFKSAKLSTSVSVAKQMINSTFRKNQIDPRTISFLNSIGAGIVNYRQTDVIVPDDIKSFMKEMMLLAKKHMADMPELDEDLSQQEKQVAIELAHLGSNEKEYFFGLEMESAGTRRLLLIMSLVFKALDKGSVIFIDELDASLHTHAVEQILFMFVDPEINKKGAQLIATTHDTNILTSKILRRDQIWFCEKDSGGASHIFALSDIKSRPSDNFEQGYLEGRYGAIPFAGNLKALFKDLKL